MLLDYWSGQSDTRFNIQVPQDRHIWYKLHCQSLSCRRSRRILFSSCFLFLLSFWQHVFFKYFPTFDFDQTWSEWPVCWPLLRHKQWWGQRSGWGHWGQKGHFHQKGIKSFKILSIDTWLMHMHKLELLYKSYGPKNSSGVIWGHRDQKVIFTKKGIKSFRIRSIYAWLTHMH